MLKNTVNLFNAVDSLFNTAGDFITTVTDHTAPLIYQYNDRKGYYDFTPIWNEITFPIIETPNYPVANGWFLPTGDLLLEIAVTKFKRSEIKVKRDDYNLVVIGDPKKEDYSDRKELFKSLAKRKFELRYSIPNKMDLDNVEVKMEDGVLSILIPIKEEMKPICKEIEIK